MGCVGAPGMSLKQLAGGAQARVTPGPSPLPPTHTPTHPPTPQYPDEFVRKHAATLVREVAKHTPELAQLVVANGGVGALVECASGVGSGGGGGWERGRGGLRGGVAGTGGGTGGWMRRAGTSR